MEGIYNDPVWSLWTPPVTCTNELYTYFNCFLVLFCGGGMMVIASVEDVYLLRVACCWVIVAVNSWYWRPTMSLSNIRLGWFSFSDSGGINYALIGDDGCVGVTGVEMGSPNNLGKFSKFMREKMAKGQSFEVRNFSFIDVFKSRYSEYTIFKYICRTDIYLNCTIFPEFPPYICRI